ncbi:MAG: hypothetical protein ACI8QS_001802 [Planctomycetota bacterium]|jgi:hypothetical protein
MKANLFFPSLLLAIGALSMGSTSAQEAKLTLGAPQATASRAQPNPARTAGSTQISIDRRGSGIRSSSRRSGRGSYDRGYGGRDNRGSYGGNRHVCINVPFWVAGHYESRNHQVFVPGFGENVWIDAIYRNGLDHCGQPTRYLVQVGHWEFIQHPGHYETRSQRVWIPGHFEQRPCCSR